MNRESILKAHVFAGSLVFPMILLFSVTGALYTFGVKGNYQTEVRQMTLPLPLDPSLGELVSVSQANVLPELGALEPTGEPTLKKVGVTWIFEWTGSRADLVIIPRAEAGSFDVQYKKTDFHRLFVQLHKAKGGALFKVWAAVFAIALVFLSFSGSWVGWTQERFKWVVRTGLGIGALVTLIAVLGS